MSRLVLLLAAASAALASPLTAEDVCEAAPDAAALVAWSSAQPDIRTTVTVARFPSTGRGLATLAPAKAGEVLYWIPKAHALSMDSTALQPSKQAVLRATVEAWATENKLAGFEHILHLSVLLLFERGLGPDSQFHPYIDTLPAVDTPPQNAATWTTVQLTALAQFTSSGMHIGGLCPAAVAKMVRGLELDPAASAGGARRYDWDKAMELAVWSCAVVISRYFGDALYPLSDMANHDKDGGFAKELLSFSFSPDCLGPMVACRFGGNGECSTVNDMYLRNKDCVEANARQGRGVIALRDYAQGEQVFDYYGTMNNAQMMAQYGVAFASNSISSIEMTPWHKSVHAFNWQRKHPWAAAAGKPTSWIRRSAALQPCVEMFDACDDKALSGDRVEPRLRAVLQTNLDADSAGFVGFDVLAIDCIMIIAQDLKSEALLSDAVRKGELGIYDDALREALVAVETTAETNDSDDDDALEVAEEVEEYIEVEEEVDPQFVPGTYEYGQKMLGVEKKLTQTLQRRCGYLTESAKQLEFIVAMESLRREPVVEGAWATDIDVKVELLRWIDAEVFAAEHCAKEMDRRLTEEIAERPATRASPPPEKTETVLELLTRIGAPAAEAASLAALLAEKGANDVVELWKLAPTTEVLEALGVPAHSSGPVHNAVSEAVKELGAAA